VTLGTSASSVTFSSIPATYRDLIVQGYIMPFGNVINAKINNSDSNFSRVRMAGDGSTFFSDSGTDRNIGDNFGATAAITFKWQLMDYSATDKHKTNLIRIGSASGRVFAFAQRWAETTAINSITIEANSGSFSLGTTLSLYGVIA
jgi:hypothetical protein